MAQRDGGIFAALRHRDFALLWSAAIVSNTGTWMQTITVPFVVFHLTHSTTWVGFAAFMTLAPAWLVGPVAGSFADRYPRKQVILATQTVMMGVALSLWTLWVTGHATPWIIIANLVVSGFASGMNLASWQAFVPQLVPPEEMLNAVRLNSMQFTAARAFGPALAGLVLAQFGPAAAFMANAVSFLVVLAALLAIRPRPIDLPDGVPPVLEHFRAGLEYVRRRRALGFAVVTAAVMGCLGSSVVQLSAPLAREVFDVGRAQYGLLVGAFGGGTAVASLFTLRFGDRIRHSRMAMVGLAIGAGSEMMLGGAPAYWVGIAALAGMGVAYMLVLMALTTSIQARVDESHRGRVMSIYLMGMLAAVPLGALVGSVIAGIVGLRAMVIAYGAALGCFAVIGGVAFDRFRVLDEMNESLQPAPATRVRTTEPAIVRAD